VQELTGQSQQRLTQLKAQIDARAEQAEAAGMAFRHPSRQRAARHQRRRVPIRCIQSARSQQNRGAQGTARMGYQELIKLYPAHRWCPMRSSTSERASQAKPPIRRSRTTPNS
jgi:hypothetical protein